MTDPAPPPSFSSRNLLALALIGLLLHLWRVQQAWQGNPMAQVPINDAEVYWDWAGRIARGELIGSEPFLSAPLYPYLLGLARALGVGLPGVFIGQALLHVGTALLLARIGTRRFDPRVGLVAGALYLFALDPSDSVTRVLAGSLQAFTVVVLLDRWNSWEGERRGLVSLGLAFGMACLANPALLVGVPVLGFDLWRRRKDLRTALLGLSIAGATIGLATLHNVAASGEWIPISAQAGVTFQHGNQAGSIGVYTASRGVSTSRIQQNRDALDEARTALGKQVGWKETSSYFFSKGLDTWSADPVAAATLAGRKLVYFLFAKDYGDIYMPRFERGEGLGPGAWSAPVRSAWFVLPGLWALAIVWVRLRTNGLPDALLAGVPLLVVCVFWYSPRYRLPALPVLALAAGWGLVHVRRHPAIGGAFLVGLGSGPLLDAIDFERTEAYRANFHAVLGGVYAALEDNDAARVAYERAQELGHPTAAISLADLVRRSQGAGAALEELRTQVRLRPEDPYGWRSLATAAAQAAGAAQLEGRPSEGLWTEARGAFERTLQLDPNDWQAHLGLGNVRLSTGDPAGAREAFATASSLVPERYEPWFGRAQAAAALQDPVGERDALEHLIERAPEPLPYLRRLADLNVASGKRGEALALLLDGLQRAPTDPGLLLASAWIQATAPEDSLRDGQAALTSARSTQARDPREEVERLDCIAAALAETGDYAGALEIARGALGQLEAAGQAPWAAELRERIAGYEAGIPWREDP